MLKYFFIPNIVVYLHHNLKINIMFIQTTPKGILKHSRTNSDGVKFYDVMIETIIFDDSPKNPSLPIIVGYYGPNNESTCAYGLTYDEAIKHIKSFGFNGEIIVK